MVLPPSALKQVLTSAGPRPADMAAALKAHDCLAPHARRDLPLVMAIIDSVQHTKLGTPSRPGPSGADFIVASLITADVLNQHGVYLAAIPTLPPPRSRRFLGFLGLISLGSLAIVFSSDSDWRARLALAVMGVIIVGFGTVTPNPFWDHSTLHSVRGLLGDPATRVLIVLGGLAIIVVAFLAPLA